MQKGKFIVDQITSSGIIVKDYDNSLSISEIRNVLEKYFCKDEEYKNSKYFVGNFEGKRFCIRAKNISYLGNPHSEFKKRIQIADDLFEFFKYSKSINATPILLGIYNYKEHIVFCNFDITTYINKKAHNSSAHVFSGDLSKASINGIYTKEDYFGNTITAFIPSYIKGFLTNKLIKGSSLDFRAEIVKMIDPLYLGLKRDWFGIDCYKEMMKSNYHNARQAEWPGFYHEFVFENHLLKTNNKEIVRLENKKEGEDDLDLYIKPLKSYADLKTHSNDKNEIPGNDLKTVLGIVENNSSSSIYYIILEHETKKDKDYNYEVTEFWNDKLGKSNPRSYGSRMKNSVKLTEYNVLEINNNNKDYLTLFSQGHQPDGSPRNPKIKINKKNINQFLIHRKML